MPIQHAVLAMLTSGPSHSYELKTRFEEAIGPQWGPWNIGHIYQIVDRLVRDGLVAGERVPQQGRPDKVLFELTDAGWRELEEWMRTPWLRQSGYRDELFLKLFAATRLGPDALHTVVADQRQVYLSELSDLAELRRGHGSDPLVDLLIEAATLHTRADLQVVEQAEVRLAETARGAGVASRGRASRRRRAAP